MALKTPVVDRIPTYPGRVTLTPVAGQANVYDMVRADSPIQEGTPINKALFDQKAYTLTEDVTVYVSKSGSDVSGDGTSAAPYLTIQKAIDSLPKCLGGFDALVDIGSGTYAERVNVEGFYGGKLTLGVSGRSVTVNGISVISSRTVRSYISNVTYSAAAGAPLIHADFGGEIHVLGPLTLRADNASAYGIHLDRGSVLTVADGLTTSFASFAAACVSSTGGSKAVMATVSGNTTSVALRALSGGVVTYGTKNITAGMSDVTATGGRILTTGGTSLANASIE